MNTNASTGAFSHRCTGVGSIVEAAFVVDCIARGEVPLDGLMSKASSPERHREQVLASPVQSRVLRLRDCRGLSICGLLPF
jgi:hypothetical protein